MKKFAPVIVGLATAFGNVGMALAQSEEADGFSNATCSLNGETVPCDQAAEALGGFMSAFAGVFMVILLIAFVAGIFTLWMFIDCLRRDFKDTTTKVLWALGMVFLNFPAALVYYFVVKRAAPVSTGSVPVQGETKYPQQ